MRKSRNPYPLYPLAHSLLLFHGYQTLYLSATHWAVIVIRRLYLLAAVEADAHVAAWHDDGVGLLGEADGALRHFFLGGRHSLDVLHLTLALYLVWII